MTNSEYQQLVEFLGRQFAAIDQRFAAIDRRFDLFAQHVDEKFGEVLAHFDELYGRLERLEQEYHAIVQGLRRIEALFADERGRREVLERSLEELKREVAALQGRIAQLEHRMRG